MFQGIDRGSGLADWLASRRLTVGRALQGAERRGSKERHLRSRCRQERTRKGTLCASISGPRTPSTVVVVTMEHDGCPLWAPHTRSGRLSVIVAGVCGWCIDRPLHLHGHWPNAALTAFASTSPPNSVLTRLTSRQRCQGDAMKPSRSLRPWHL